MSDRKLLNEPLRRFFSMFKDALSVDDHMEFFANHKEAAGETYLRMETYTADKLARVIMEEYSVRSDLRGNVIVVTPQPNTDVPIFFFQLGGKEDRSIAVLDISPTLARADYSPLIPVYEKYSAALGLGPTKVDWMTKICSPYLLSCQYESLDDALFIEAMCEYFRVWVEHFYQRRAELEDEREVELVSNAIYKFKYVLHHHDPAYKIFSKSWGKTVADAFVYLECADDPAYRPPEGAAARVKAWMDWDRNVQWTADAQLQVLAAPEAERESIRESIESQVAAAGFGIVTPELLQKYWQPEPAVSGG
jgi:hypothetical protein